MYLSASLPFAEQKQMFAKEFMRVLEQFPEDTMFMDLFGGSGLLSYIVKCWKPDATVTYNDSDNYHRRMVHIPRTNRLIADIHEMVRDVVPRHRPITRELCERIFRRIGQGERTARYVDFVTLSSSLMLSMRCRLSVPEMRKGALYNNMCKADYPECAGYLDGLEIMSCGYKEIFGRYKDTLGVVFLVDSPYLSTDVNTYNMY